MYRTDAFGFTNLPELIAALRPRSLLFAFRHSTLRLAGDHNYNQRARYISSCNVSRDEKTMSQSIPNPYSPPKAPVVQEPQPPPESALAREGPEGLGGWLILVGLGLLVSPIRLVIFIAQTYVPLVRDGTLQALATPGSESFRPVFAALIVVEALANIFCLGFAIWLIVLFFQKSRRFPLRYVTLAALSVAIILADSFAISALELGSPWDAEGMQELIRSLIGLCVWGPYMYISTRVENTFVQR
jgi:hypothetical protein